MTEKKASAFIILIFFVLQINFCLSQTKVDSIKAISYWQKTDSIDSIATKLSSLAFGYWEANFPTKAIETYKEAISIRNDRREYDKLKSLYTSLGLIYSNLKQYDSALIAFKNGYDASRRFNDKTEIISGMIIIALAYERLSQYDKAIDMLFKAEKISNELNNTKYLKDCYLHLSNNYFLSSNDVKSLQYLKLYDSVSKLISVGNIISEDTIVCVDRYKLNKEMLIQNNNELKILNDFHSNELVEGKYLQYELKRKNKLNFFFLIMLLIFSIIVTCVSIIVFIIYKKQKNKVDYLKLSEEKFRMFYEYCTTPFLLLKDDRVVECNYAFSTQFS
ncbi:MAG: tetratricopeptide repeat protein [Bacteroidales bacterium]|nr:tetratricopeptide repeat protein [Bacteroidales bacterium]